MSESDNSFLGKRVFVAGHRGMVGSALLQRLSITGCEIITADRNLDLRRQRDTEDWMAEVQPQIVFLAAAKVGGILANRDYPADFVYDNLMIGANVMEASRRAGVEKLVFLGSSCIYPKHAPQPIPEEALLTGPLEPTNDAYAIAKIAGIRMARAYRTQYGCRFICAQPCNLYGPRDNFNLEAGHVLPALMRKAHEAKLAKASELVVWGSGAPLREFLHVDDLADALVFLAERYDGDDIINIGSGEEVSIRELATVNQEITDKIIAELEVGCAPWVQPWGTSTVRAPLGMPKNATTHRRYTGINVLILWGAVIQHGFTGQSWLTFRQALSLDGHVRKGERGTTVVYADRFTPEDERRRAADAGEEAQAIPFLKRFIVFNVAQCSIRRSAWIDRAAMSRR